MNNEETLQALKTSDRRLRLGLVATAVATAALVLGGMQDEQGANIGPHLVGISSSASTTEAGDIILFRMWSNGQIDRRQYDEEDLYIGNNTRVDRWQVIQRP